MALRARNAVVLAKIESTVGTDSSPVQGSDAILVENPTVDPQVGVINTDEVTGSLDSEGPIVSGIRGRITFSSLLRGSGAAGTAPEIGKLLRACGWAETITASAVPAAPEACGAGGSTTTAQLGASASATAQAYRGMPVNISSAITLSSFITDYTSGKVATLTDIASGTINAGSNYQIPINVLYAPASVSIPSLTMYVYMDGVLYKFVGCRGSFSLSVDAGGIGRINWDFMGHYVSKTDIAVPSAPVYDTTRPPVWRNGIAKINRIASAMASLGLDPNNTVVMPGDPNKAEGFDYPIITRRDMSGSMNPLEELVATRDVMTAFRDGTRQIVHAKWGSSAGNRIGITIPQAHYTAQSPANRDELLAVSVPFKAVGKDSAALICFY